MSANVSKGHIGLPMEGPIARWYAANTRKDLAHFKKDARLVAEHTPPGGAVLEVAPGPGYLAIELARLGDFRVTGLDISRSFVRIAQQNAQAAGVSVDFRHGNASRMPFAAAQFDSVVCRAAFKNFADPIGALNEMRRVLRPGGRAVILDLRADASWGDVDRYVAGMGLGWANALLTKWIFRNMLLPRAYTRGAFERLAAQSAFGRCEIEAGPVTLAVWLAK